MSLRHVLTLLGKISDDFSVTLIRGKVTVNHTNKCRMLHGEVAKYGLDLFIRKSIPNDVRWLTIGRTLQQFFGT